MVKSVITQTKPINNHIQHAETKLNTLSQEMTFGMLNYLTCTCAFLINTCQRGKC